MSIVTLIEWMRDIQTDPATGLNAQLPNVPRRSDQPPPDPVEIYNEIDHEWTARDIIPAQLLLDENNDARGLFIIRMHPEPQGFQAHLLPEFEQADPTLFPVVLLCARRFIVKEDSNLTVDAMRRDLKQTMRTAHRVLAQQFESAHTAIPRDGCTIMLPRTGITINTQLVETPADLVVETIVAPMRIFDPWALGIS